MTGQKQTQAGSDSQSPEDGRPHDLQKALDQRTGLLHELDHRVKNNLQLISSLMLLQARHAREPAVKSALEAMHERLSAIAVVHRGLFRTEDPGRFDIAAFVRDLASELSASARPGLRIVLDLEPVAVGTGHAAALALLINELLINALRHAYPEGRQGEVRVKITRSGSEMRIGIADDGVGMANANQEQGFGLSIVDLLSRQLQARVAWEDSHPGVHVAVTLPVEAE